MRTEDGSKCHQNWRYLLKLRAPQYTNEETSGDDDKQEASTTFSEDCECDKGVESEPTLNQRPTANQPALVMCNEPCTTQSGGVMKPHVRLDL